jgi:dTDP-4-amino-4,6-dideoxygalactose transaminase
MTSAATSPAAIRVPLLDLKAQYQTLRPQIEVAIREVCDSQQFVLGPKVEELERRIADYCAVKFAIGMSSGTDALLAALMAFDIGPGDEVITSPYSFFATAGVVARLGARPVFCDIDPDTYNLDPEAVARFLRDDCRRDGERLVNRATGGRVRVLMPVHLYGQMADMPPLLELARRYGLHLIEDAAQAIGSEDSRGARAGGLGDIGCLSFFPSKNLGAFGDAGMCLTQDAKLAQRLKVLRVHGGETKYYHSIVGGNFRIDALQAAVLVVKLSHLDAWTAGRQRNAARYTELFAAAGSGLVTPSIRDGYRHIFNQYVIRARDRDGLRQHVAGRGIGCEIYYPVPLHLQKCFEALGYHEGDLPVSEEAARTTLALPVYPELSSEQLEYVARSVLEFVQPGDRRG